MTSTLSLPPSLTHSRTSPNDEKDQQLNRNRAIRRLVAGAVAGIISVAVARSGVQCSLTDPAHLERAPTATTLCWNRSRNTPHPPPPRPRYCRTVEWSIGASMSASDADVVDFLSGEVERLTIEGDGDDVGVVLPMSAQDAATAAATTGHQLLRPDPSALTRFSQKQVARDVMYRTSEQERELALAEIHGVADPVEETAQLVSDSLRRMEDGIQRRLNQRRRQQEQQQQQQHNPSCHDASSAPFSNCLHAYERALLMDGDLVRSDSYRIPFLRADRFDADGAAERFLLHFEEKENLFGTETLTRPVLLADLNEDSRARLESGFIQLLPNRDASGRAVLVGFGHVQKEVEDESEIQIMNQVREDNVSTVKNRVLLRGRGRGGGVLFRGLRYSKRAYSRFPLVGLPSLSHDFMYLGIRCVPYGNWYPLPSRTKRRR
jgi:hypothetical protein